MQTCMTCLSVNIIKLLTGVVIRFMVLFIGKLELFNLSVGIIININQNSLCLRAILEIILPSAKNKYQYLKSLNCVQTLNRIHETI